MKAKRIAKAIAFILLLVFLWNQASFVEAAGFGPVPDLEQSHPSTITITLSYRNDQGSTVSISGIHITLYQVAKLSVTQGVGTYTSVDPFHVAGIDFDEMMIAQSKEDAQKCANLALTANVVGETKQTESDGTVIFSEETPGLYLAVLEEEESEKTGYVMAPFFIQAPAINAVDGQWQYVSVVQPKFSITQVEQSIPPVVTPTPQVTNTPSVSGSSTLPNTSTTIKNEFISTPKTGDSSNTTVWWLICIGSALGIIIVVLPGRKKDTTSR